MRNDDQQTEQEEITASGKPDAVGQPQPAFRTLETDDVHHKDGEPDDAGRAHCVATSLLSHVSDSGQEHSHDSREDAHAGSCETGAEHDNPRHRDSDGDRARKPYGKRGCPEHLHPEMQEQVIGAVHRVHTAKHSKE